MSDEPMAQMKRGIPLAGIAVVTLLVMLVAGAIVYYIFVQKPLSDRLNFDEAQMSRMMGLQAPNKGHHLNPRYTDTDGDLIASCPTDPSQQIDPARLNLSYVYTDTPDPLKTAFVDFVKYLSTQTGKPVDYEIFNSVEAQTVALRDGKLQVTAMNTGNVPMAVCEAGFVPVACMGNDRGVTTYQMVILVRANSPVMQVSDLRGHELALNTPNSNSGYKAPLVLLRNEYGLEPGRDYSIRFTSGHPASIKGLADGTFEAIAVANDVLNRELASGTIRTDQYRIIYTSAGFPTAAVGYAYNLKPELADKIRAAILNFDWTGTSMETYFSAAGQNKFIPVNYKNDWALIREIDDGFPYTLETPLTPPLGMPVTVPSTMPTGG